jgi:type II restriction/modification system DNA methylase subunit YeeA
MQNINGVMLTDRYKDCNYKTFIRTGDMYQLFYEQGMNFLCQNGYLCLITSNKWMRAGYGEKTRKFLTEKVQAIQLIDFAGQKVFESATVDVNIILIKKTEQSQGETSACIIKEKRLNNLTDYVRQHSTKLEFPSGDSWVILNPIEKRIKEKIESVGKPLKDWDISINYGIKTGCNEAFIIDKSKRDELISKDSKSAELIRPI